MFLGQAHAPDSDRPRPSRWPKNAGRRDHVPLHEELAWGSTWTSAAALDLERALDELEVLDERKAKLIELRYFLGLLDEERAEILGVSLGNH